MTGTSRLKSLNESRQDIEPGTKVAFVDCEGRLRHGVAVEIHVDGLYLRRVRIREESGNTVSPSIERVAVL